MTKDLPGRKFQIWILACVLLASGCTSLHPVNIAQEPERAAVAKGDTVVITTKDGQIHTFRVVDITTGGLHGEELSVPYSDMQLLQIRRVHMQKTILLTIGIIGIGALVSDDNGGSDGY